MSNTKSRNIAYRSLEVSSNEIMKSRRAYTVPQQLLRSYELPALTSVHTIPKRYEETRPVKLQDFTHQQIIALGELINRQSHEKQETFSRMAVEKAVASTWEAAHQIKVEAVQEALNALQIQHEKQLKKLSRQHERRVKEEILTVETKMQNKMREALEAERKLANQKLEEAISKVKADCATQLRLAVEAAREQERETAKIQLEHAQREFESTLEDTKTVLQKEKEQALEKLKEKMNKEQVDAIKKVHGEELVIRQSALAELRAHLEMKIDSLNNKINELEKEILARDEIIVSVQSKRELLYDQLVQAQTDFQHFIDHHPRFDSGQTNYLLPNVIANPQILNPYLEKQLNP